MEKDRKCEAYIHTYKCDAKTCNGCKYRYKSLATGILQTGKSRDIGTEIKAYTDKTGNEPLRTGKSDTKNTRNRLERKKYE